MNRVVDHVSHHTHLNRIIARLPAQSPAPEEIAFGAACVNLLREARSIQKNMHDSYIAQEKTLPENVVGLLRQLPTPSICPGVVNEILRTQSLASCSRVHLKTLY